MSDEQAEVKELAIESSMVTVRLYRDLLDHLEKDLKDASDESRQQAAALAIRTFHLFIVQEEGYNTWHRALHNFVRKELMDFHNISVVH